MAQLPNPNNDENRQLNNLKNRQFSLKAITVTLVPRLSPGNAWLPRHCLSNCQYGTSFSRRFGRQSLQLSAFPGRAWERGRGDQRNVSKKRQSLNNSSDLQIGFGLARMALKCENPVVGVLPFRAIWHLS